MTRRVSIVLFLSAFSLTLGSCSKQPVDTPIGNIPPETYLSLFPDSTLRETTSRQHIHWWGDDPDGFIAGYLITFDGMSWTFTTKNDSVFSLTILGMDTTYAFSVRAVDGQGNGLYDIDGIYGPEPFSDVNGNGRHDPGEPWIDLGLADPTPASLSYPIQNTPPQVEFIKGTEVPETTFTVATFSWIGTDLDGDETIDRYFYALNDTGLSAWKELPRTKTMLTVFEQDGLRPGRNTFYLKAVDIAGASSAVIRMPDTSRTWYVKQPSSELLIVDDYGISDGTSRYYNSIFDTLLAGRFRDPDIFDIKLGASSVKKGILVPPFINPTFVETLKLFTYVLWYADNNPALDIAQLSLKAYTDAGGKVIYTAAFPESALDPRGGIVDFAPVDSLNPNTITFVPANTKLLPDSEAAGYPELKRDASGVPVAFVREAYKKINATNLYRLEPGSFWNGSPVVGIRSGGSDFILFSIPLHRFDGNGTVGQVLWRIFSVEFGVR